MATSSRPSSDFGFDEQLAAVEIARRHYLHGATKSELAREYRMSRFKIAGIIAQARAQGLVRIIINTPLEFDAALSEQLKLAVGLEHAIVVNAPDDQMVVRRRIAATAADLLSEIVVDGDVLGVALGRTLSVMASHLLRIARCTSVALTGVISEGDLTQSSLEILHRVAVASGGPSSPIYAPWVVSGPVVAQRIREEPTVARALRRHSELTVAIVAIGSWNPSNSTLFDAASPAEQRWLQERGVRAEIAGVLLDSDGHPVDSELSRRLVGVSWEHLKEVPHVIGVAGGRSKWQAIQAALRGGLVRSLVTDAGTARFLMNAELGARYDRPHNDL